MFPFVKLNDDDGITLRPFNFGEEDELYDAVHSSLPELNPWMSWANESYTKEFNLSDPSGYNIINKYRSTKLNEIKSIK